MHYLVTKMLISAHISFRNDTFGDICLFHCRICEIRLSIYFEKRRLWYRNFICRQNSILKMISYVLTETHPGEYLDLILNPCLENRSSTLWTLHVYPTLMTKMVTLNMEAFLSFVRDNHVGCAKVEKLIKQTHFIVL